MRRELYIFLRGVEAHSQEPSYAGSALGHLPCPSQAGRSAMEPETCLTDLAADPDVMPRLSRPLTQCSPWRQSGAADLIITVAINPAAVNCEWIDKWKTAIRGLCG